MQNARIWPAPTGPSAAETADPDTDGVPNLSEPAFGFNPLAPDSSRAAVRIPPVAGGWRVEAILLEPGDFPFARLAIRRAR